jgi:hypothetical protein
MATAGLALALGACSQGDGVASLDPGGDGLGQGSEQGSRQGPAEPEAAQAAAADAMAGCLTAAGIEAAAEEMADPGWNGQKSLAIGGAEPNAVSFGEGEPRLSARGAQTVEDNAAALERLRPGLRAYAAERYLDILLSGESQATSPPGAEPDPSAAEAAAEPPVFLIVGEVDQTEAFRACIAESGYTEPVFRTDPAQEIAEKQATEAATVAWVKCARENGYPALADPAPAVADEWMTTPTAVLPADTTSADLAALLEACPAEDYAEDHDGAPMRAEIGFDVPGFRGDIRESAAEDDQAAVDRAHALQQQVMASLSVH